MGRVDRGPQDGVCSVADEALASLPRRRPPGERRGEDLADAPRSLPDLNLLRQVLAGLRRLD